MPSATAAGPGRSGGLRLDAVCPRVASPSPRAEGPRLMGRHQIAQPHAQAGRQRIELEREHAGGADLGGSHPHHQALDREGAPAGEGRGKLQREGLTERGALRGEQPAAALRDLGEDRAVSAQPRPEVNRRPDAHARRAPLLGPAIERVQQQEPQGGRVDRASHHQLEARAAQQGAHGSRLAIEDGDPEGGSRAANWPGARARGVRSRAPGASCSRRPAEAAPRGAP